MKSSFRFRRLALFRLCRLLQSSSIGTSMGAHVTTVPNPGK